MLSTCTLFQLVLPIMGIDIVQELKVRTLYLLSNDVIVELLIIYLSLDYFDAADSAFKKIKLLQESSLEHHPTSVSCPTPARRRHRTTFTQVREGEGLGFLLIKKPQRAQKL